MSATLPRFIDCLLTVDRVGARAIALAQGPTGGVIDSLIVPALDEIGHGWDAGVYSLSQVYLASRICEELSEGWLPVPAGEDGPAVAVALLRDHHSLGKRIVAASLRGAGMSVIDYGTMEADEMVRRTVQDAPAALLISTLMLPSALRVRDVVRGLRNAGSQVPVVVGGAPFRLDDRLWRDVEADAVGRTAADAVTLARRLTTPGGGL